MAMGTRKRRQRQESLWYQAEMAQTPGHPFYEKLNRALESAKFDSVCEQQCQEFYDEQKGRPSLPPGVYFRLMLLGFFEGIDSERGIAWRVADSLSLRQFIGYDIDEATPDHVTISRTRRLLTPEKHQCIFHWVLEQLAHAGLIRGKTIGVDSTTLEANAAMKSIVRRDTGEGYTEYLQRLAAAEGVEANDAAALRRMDRKRTKKMSNEDWVSASDAEAEITRLKDGRTALAFKVENAVDMETGAIVAVTTHGGAAADTETVEETVIEAGVAVAGVAGEQAPRVHAQGVQEVVADRGYHSNEVLRQMEQLRLRTYIAEPERGTRNWEGKAEAKAAVYGNRRRVQGSRGKRLQRRRGERIERNFAHQFDTGGMDRLWVRGAGNVQKKVLLQAAACNLALLMRAWYGAGKPKAAHDQMEEAILATLVFLAAISHLSGRPYRPTALAPIKFRLRPRPRLRCLSAPKSRV